MTPQQKAELVAAAILAMGEQVKPKKVPEYGTLGVTTTTWFRPEDFPPAGAMSPFLVVVEAPGPDGTIRHRVLSGSAIFLHGQGPAQDGPKAAGRKPRARKGRWAPCCGVMPHWPVVAWAYYPRPPQMM